MTERARKAIPAVLLVLIVMLSAATLYLGRDEYQELAREHGATIGTQTTVDEMVEPGKLRLPDKERQTAGLGLAPLAAAEGANAVEVFGTVVDIQPLVEARTRYLAQSGEIRVLRATTGHLESEYRRAQALFNDERNVSERVMRAAESEWKGARERLTAADAALRALVESVRHAWGSGLADMALNPGSPAFRGLLEGREVLASVTIPHDVTAALANARLSVVPAGSTRPIAAAYLAPAIASGGNVVGVTHFYRVPGASLRVGSRLTGYLSAADAKAEGVLVPESAVVWFAGRSWVYVRDEKDRDIFERTPVSTSRLLPGGWFNATGFEAGQEVVVVGAQLLLSEELEYQIRNENED